MAWWQQQSAAGLAVRKACRCAGVCSSTRGQQLHVTHSDMPFGTSFDVSSDSRYSCGSQLFTHQPQQLGSSRFTACWWWDELTACFSCHNHWEAHTASRLQPQTVLSSLLDLVSALVIPCTLRPFSQIYLVGLNLAQSSRAAADAAHCSSSSSSTTRHMYPNVQHTVSHADLQGGRVVLQWLALARFQLLTGARPPPKTSRPNSQQWGDHHQHSCQALCYATTSPVLGASAGCCSPRKAGGRGGGGGGGGGGGSSCSGRNILGCCCWCDRMCCWCACHCCCHCCCCC